MTWTQGQPSRANQSPFIDPEKEPRNGRMSPNYNKGNDRRNDPNQKYTPNPTRTTHTRSEPPVAATFTQEGLQTFSLIFSSAVEAAIAKSLPSIVEQAVRRELDSAIREIREEIGQTITGFLSDLVHNAQTTIEKRIHEMIDASVHVPAVRETDSQQDEVLPTKRDTEALPSLLPSNEPSVAVHQETIAIEPELSVSAEPEIALSAGSPTSVDSPIYGDTEEAVATPPPVQTPRRTELEIVLSTLKSLGRPVRTNELEDLIGDVAWGSNPSIKMSYFMNRSDGRIERVGRGLYQYSGATAE